MGQDNLPLPDDAPHCGNYDTRFEEIFAGKHVPDGEHLHQLIGLSYQDLRRQAADVAAASNVLNQVSSGRAADSDGGELLQAYQVFALGRREFVAAVRDYNIHIARYSEIASPGKLATRRLVAMLIKTDLRTDDAVRRATAEEAIDNSRDQPSTSRTRKPRMLAPEGAARPRGGERSILVRPRRGILR